MAAGGADHVDAFVGSFVVVHMTKVVKDPLLLAEARCASKQGALEQSTMHSLVAAVLLGMSGSDEDGLNAELHQADAEDGEPTKTVSAKGGSIVTENGLGQAMLAEHTFHNRPDKSQTDRRQCLAGKQVTTHRVGHRQRPAPSSIAESKLALEVDGMELPWLRGFETLSKW